MTATFWFLLGLWVGCSAGFLLSACVSVARDAEQQADSALKRLLVLPAGSHRMTSESE